MINTGTLYIVSAPSGAGKSSLIQALINSQPSYDLKISVSYTTRKQRPGEKEGEHYYFVDHTTFERMIQEDTLLEYAKVFEYYYGTSRHTIEEYLARGIDVFLDIDWQGARQTREKFPEARSIFILPPSREELERRLYQRGQDAAEIIDKRMQKAVSEMSHYHEYDYLIINDDFELALHDLKTIIRAEKLCLCKQEKKYLTLINKLLLE